MRGKKGMSNFSWVVIVVVVLGVALAGLNYYNVSILGAETQVLPAMCVANPELVGLDDATIRSKTELASFGDVNTRCGKFSTSIQCTNWKVAGSTQNICVWSAHCGNGIIEIYEGEQCDGDEFGGKTCVTYGKANGKLFCRNDCKVSLNDCY